LTVTFDGSESQSFVGDGKLSYQWKLKKKLESETFSEEKDICVNQEPTVNNCTYIFCQGGDYQVTLMVTDSGNTSTSSDPLSVKISGTQYPYLVDEGNCQAWIAKPNEDPDPNGPLVLIAGGISTNGGDSFSNSNIALGEDDFQDSVSTNKVIIKAEILAPKDVGGNNMADKPADILVLVNYTPYETVPQFSPWYMLKENTSGLLISYPFQKNWDLTVSQDNPEGFFNDKVTLNETRTVVNIFQGQLVRLKGIYKVYVGYRLTGQDPIQIIFAPNPIEFTIE